MMFWIFILVFVSFGALETFGHLLMRLFMAFFGFFFRFVSI